MTTVVDNIEHIESQSLYGTAVVKVFLQPNASLDRAIAQITASSQTQLRQLPAGTTPPLIIVYSASSVPVMQLALSGKGLSEQELNDYGLNFIRTQLITIPGAAVGLAKTAYYPLVNLAASGGFESGTITTLLQGPSAFWSIGASAAATIFDAGRRHALNDEAKSAYDSSVASYRQTVLSAFRQVEDHLTALRVLEDEAGIQTTAVKSALRSLDLSNTRYEGGVTSYLEVITAQNAALSDEVTAVNILGRRMSNAVLLIEALGGGWNRSNLPAYPEGGGKLAMTSK